MNNFFDENFDNIIGGGFNVNFIMISDDFDYFFS